MAWLGWLSLCPALGFPTLATAGMVNRLLLPREDPGFWFGWGLLLIGLAFAVLVYLVATARSRWRPSIASGVAYGALCWLVVGAAIMPLLGLLDPLAASPTPNDPMRGSFMMLHLGLGAPIAALVAWLLLGAALGATASLNETARRPALGGAVAIVAVLAIVVVMARMSESPSPTAGASEPLAAGPVAALPADGAFVSIIALPQPPGATLGPHAHVAGFAYSLKGVATMVFDDGRTVRVGPGQAGFMGTQEAHAHLNAQDQVPAAALALLIVGLVVVVCLLSLRSVRRDGLLLPIALVLLTAAGAVGIWNPWSNDWLFVSIRPAAARGGPMPLPDASRVYESPDIGQLPPAPYTETVEQLTLAAGETRSLESAGVAALFVLAGRIDVQPAGELPVRLEARGGSLLQQNAPVAVTNVGDGPAQLLIFEVTPTATS